MDNQYPNHYKTPNMQALPQTMADDEIDLRELFVVIWKGKWLIILITFIFAVGAVFFALSQPNIYKSEVLLAPVTEDSNKMSALASQFGGLASLAGINMGSSGGDKTTLTLAVLNSRKFINQFVNKHVLKIALFAGKSWNESTGQLVLDTEIYDSEKQIWLREVDPGKSPEPTDWEVYKEFKKIYAITTDKETGMITISIESLSPIIAKQWLDKLVKDINAEMREKDLFDSERNIKYLKKNLEQTDYADMQTVFYQLIEQELKTQMLAQVQAEYAFKIIDPAVAAEEKSKPKRALIAVLGTLLGGMLGVMLVLVRHFMRKEENIETARN